MLDAVIAIVANGRRFVQTRRGERRGERATMGVDDGDRAEGWNDA
jgi:hypothetical protein